MRHTRQVLFLLIFAGSILLVACSERVSPSKSNESGRFSDCASFVEDGPDVDAVRKAEAAGARTNVDGDTLKNAKDFFAPEFWNVLPNGQVWDGADRTLAMYQNGRLTPWARSFDLEDLRVRVYCGRFGVTTGIGKALPINAPENAEPIRYRFLHFWTRHEDEWRFAAQQFVGFNPES